MHQLHGTLRNNTSPTWLIIFTFTGERDESPQSELSLAQGQGCTLPVPMHADVRYIDDVLTFLRYRFENHADITVDSSSHSLSLLLQPNTSNPAPATPVPQNASSAAVVGSYLQFNGDPKKAVVSAKAPANWKAEAPVGKVIGR